MSTQRLVWNSYIKHLTNVPCRYEPTDWVKKVKEQHVWDSMYCKSIDVKVSDRVICDGKTRVVKERDLYDDMLWKHCEIIMRQLDSEFHENVSVKKLSSLQPDFDPILEQYIWDKQYEVTTLSVLLDEIEATKNSWIRIIDAGKLENIDLVMTTELDISLDSDDRVVRQDWTEYEIKWIATNVYQKLVWLKKSVVSNYKNNG